MVTKNECTNDDRFPSRKNPRLKDFDYSTPNYYFLTICTFDKKCIFGKPGNPNHFGKIAEDGMNQISLHYPEARVDKYVVMPNHVHLILVLEHNGMDVPNIISSYKAFVTKMIHLVNPNLKVWQTSFHDHVIRNQKSYEKIWNYIDTNPIRWEEDCFYHC